MQEDVQVLREILQRELETINAYERMLERLKDPKLRELVAHVTDEEREHVAEMYELIRRYDPAQEERGQRALSHLAQVLEAQAPTSPATAAAGPPPGEPPVVFPDGTFSVGSLRPRRG